MSNWNHEVDFLVVGSGGGGMTAAITAHHHGLNTLLIEKSPVYGGTTALSGGVIWIPNNHLMASANVQDSEAEAMEYLKAVVSDDVPEARLKTYVREAAQMVKFLEDNTLVKYDPAPVYPDYYAEKKGGKPGARSMDPKPYSRRKLGKELTATLRPNNSPKNVGFSMTAAEAHVVFSFQWYSNLIIFKLLFGYWLDIPSRLKKLPDNRLTLGKALIARLRHSMAKKDIPLWLNTPLKELVKEDGKVVGVVCEKDGKPFRIRAKKGVLLATGGFSRNDEMRQQYLSKPTGTQWTPTSPDDTGDGILAGQQAGAQLGMMNYMWGSPTMVLPDGDVEALIVAKSMPGCVLVNKAGQRILNEAEPYEDFVKDQYSANTEAVPSIPSYLVFDARYRAEYPLGMMMAPGKFTPDVAYGRLFKAGWVRKADTIKELADKWGINAEGLAKTVEKAAEFAKTGKDTDFSKGETRIDRYYSDHRVTPNPCLAPLDKAPFYAIEIWPGDLGTKGGLVADEYARVLDDSGNVMEGLYVTGNTSASVMGNSYPGAGSTIGPSMTFGYVAARHAAGIK